MKNFQWIITGATGIVAIAAFLLVFANTNSGTNIDTENAGYAWGWNDVIGWINMHDTHAVRVSAYRITGSASSAVGDILFNCATCDSANFETANDGTGQLSGWAWNDAIGWISMRGTTANALPYGVRIDPSGDNINSYFHGWAWNDAVGWINFNCLDSLSCAVVDYKTQTSAGSKTADATFTSTIIDIGTNTGIFNTIVWKGSQPGNTSVQFSIAASNDKNELVNNPAYGQFLPASAGIPLQLTIENKRYIRYRVALKTDNWQTVSPEIDDILINYSP